MKIGIYARVSTTDQDCSQQLQQLREYAAARGWQIEGEYIDNGHSGEQGYAPGHEPRLFRGSVTRIPAAVASRIVPFVSQMLRQLGAQSPL